MNTENAITTVPSIRLTLSFATTADAIAAADKYLALKQQEGEEPYERAKADAPPSLSHHQSIFAAFNATSGHHG